MKKLIKNSFYAVTIVLILGWAFIFGATIKFYITPYGTALLDANNPECVSAEITQKKFDKSVTEVSVFEVPTNKGAIKIFYYRAVKNRKGKGALLIHGGGANHNLMNPYAHYLSQRGWDSLALDLPNHGCSYNNLKGIQYGKEELNGFDKVYAKAQTLFKVEVFIASSMGSTLAVMYGFPNKLPVNFILENPMISLQRIISDQNIYYLPSFLKPFLEWQLLLANSELNLKPITQYKPEANQKILLMYGTKDGLTPREPQAAELLKSWGSNTQLEIIDGAWHSQLIQHAPGQVQKIVDEFLNIK